MQNEKWILNGTEIEIPITNDKDIDKVIDVNLCDTIELSTNSIKENIDLEKNKETFTIKEEN